MYEFATDASLLTIIDTFAAHGWTAKHIIRPGGELGCGSCGRTSPARAAIVDALHRVEGPTDPVDFQLVVGLHCPYCDSAGTIVAACGPLANDSGCTFVEAMRTDNPVDPAGLDGISHRHRNIAIHRPASSDGAIPELLPGTVASKYPPPPAARRAHRDANSPLGHHATVEELAADYDNDLNIVQAASHWWARRMHRLPSDHHRAQRTLAVLDEAARTIRDNQTFNTVPLPGRKHRRTRERRRRGMSPDRRTTDGRWVTTADV